MGSSALILGMTSAAGAATSPPTPKAPTVACQVTSPICNEPVVAIAQTSANDFDPHSDAALSVVSGNRVFTRIRNTLDNGTQDWTANVDGFVPNSGSGDYGFTAFDRLHWGGRPFISEEWTPFGQSTGLCLNLRYSDKHGVLSPCDGRRGEEFIISSHVPTILPPASSSYKFAISVRHSPNTARHLLLTANEDGFGQVFGGNPVHHSPGQASNQMWSAINS
jgi:hypothetical protein